MGSQDLDNALIKAAREGNLAQVKKCIEAGADMDTKVYNFSHPPIRLAMDGGYEEIVRYLLDHGAKLVIGTQSAGSFAKQHNHDYVLPLLQKAEWTLLAKETPEWSLFGSSKIAHVEISPIIARKLTEIFNFESRKCIVISENMKTGAEVEHPAIGFDELPEITVKKALEQFKQLGGEADEEFVLRHTLRIDKKASGPMLSMPGR